MQELPQVSICIPTYNHANVVGDALRSAMAQTYGSVEILVLDNASADNTSQVVADVAGRDARVRYIRNEANLGMVGNFSACISAARGEYIKFLCADDLLEPDCVSMLVDAFEGHPETALVATTRLLVDDSMAPLRTAGFSRRSLRVDGGAAIRDCFFRGNLIGEPTAVMFRRQQASRGFRQEYPQLMDLEMWMHLLQSGSLSFIAQPLCKIRQHPQQATRMNLKSGIVLDNKQRLFREFRSVVTGATVINKLRWDIRMAVTLLRTTRAQSGHFSIDVKEVFFRPLFSWFTCPAARLIWMLVERTR
jgi:glycosyltransferase involved in cell wall biosynthesis